MPLGKFSLKYLFKNIGRCFNSEYCKELSDTLWKSRVEWIKSQAKKVPAQSKVLDVGAGDGAYKSYFKNCEYVAQDFLQTPDLAYGKIDVVSDITNIPLRSNEFDVILCSEVFEHIPYPEKSLKEIVRLLKPGGKLIFSAPLGSGQHQQPYHFYGGYTRFWYEKFFPDNGLKIDSLIPNGGQYGHTAELLWRSQPQIIEYFHSKGIIGRFLAYWVQILVYNLPTVVLWSFEKKQVIEDFTPGFFVTATKVGKR